MRIYLFIATVACLFVSCKNVGSVTLNNGSSEQADDLFFSKDAITKDTATNENFVDSFILNEDEFLSIHFTLEKPLIKSLQALEPTLTEDELLANGNFQFSFLVDGELIYVEEVNTGAGLRDSKTIQVDHTVRLVTPEQIDFWGWFMWLRFTKLGGGQDALSEGAHSLEIQVRPYVKKDALNVGEVLAQGSITVQVPKIQVDEALVPLQKIQANSGWELSKDSFDVSKMEALNRKIAERRFEDINGIVVLKDGQLLIEQYFNGESRESLHNPRSVGKSIASTMMGVAIDEKYIQSEEALLKDFYDLRNFKNYSTTKDSVTLKSLLTMSSGFVGDDDDYSNPGNEENMYPTDNWVQFTLDLPMQEDKEMGEDFTYFTAGIVVLGDVIHKSVPNGLVMYADEKLFAPLGITNYKWQYTPQKVGNTAGGLQLRALDFAKYGQLYKNKGMWNGQQILTQAWVEKSLAKQVQRSASGGYYGYLFWNKTYTHRDTAYEVSFCSGRGGNKIFIFKDLPYVIVITSSAYNIPNAHQNVDNMMENYILPALLN